MSGAKPSALSASQVRRGIRKSWREAYAKSHPGRPSDRWERTVPANHAAQRAAAAAAYKHMTSPAGLVAKFRGFGNPGRVIRVKRPTPGIVARLARRLARRKSERQEFVGRRAAAAAYRSRKGGAS